MTIAAIIGAKGSQVDCIDAADDVARAVALLAGKRIGAAPVVQDGEVVGILSERDVLYCLQAEGADVLGKPVAQVMTAPAITVTRDQPILGALALMTQRRIRHLPVVEDGRLLGIVSIGDLVKYRIERIEAEAEAMRAYIQS